MADDRPIVSVDIAHIRGANPRSARFDVTMTDRERASIRNLILLCTAHHKLVDRLEPERFNVEVLTDWKSINEPEYTLASLGDEVNDSNLESLLEDLIERRGPIRVVAVDFLAGIEIEPGQRGVMPIAQLRALLKHNPHYVGRQLLLVARVRNIGYRAVSIEAVDIHYALAPDHASPSGDFTLLGRNDFPYENPRLPYRLEDAEAMTWIQTMETAEHVADRAAPLLVQSVSAEVRLATGETVRSDPARWPFR
jgi:hypothetical protein